MLYRIFTEDKNKEQTEKLVTKYYPGFTIIKAQGFWRLQPENSLIIEIVSEDQRDKVEKLCRDIKEANQQESVLLQVVQNEQVFI